MDFVMGVNVSRTPDDHTAPTLEAFINIAPSSSRNPH